MKKLAASILIFVLSVNPVFAQSAAAPVSPAKVQAVATPPVKHPLLHKLGAPFRALHNFWSKHI